MKAPEKTEKAMKKFSLLILALILTILPVGCAEMEATRPEIPPESRMVIFEHEIDVFPELTSWEMAGENSVSRGEPSADYRKQIYKLLGGCDPRIKMQVVSGLWSRDVELSDKVKQIVHDFGRSLEDFRNLCEKINYHQTRAQEYDNLAKKMSDPANKTQVEWGLYSDTRANPDDADWAAKKHSELAARIKQRLPEERERVHEALSRLTGLTGSNAGPSDKE
jgi:hypothetical protein